MEYFDFDDNLDPPEEERRIFDLFSVLRIVDRTYNQFQPDLSKIQEECQKRLRGIGLPIDLEETQQRHENRTFHENAEVVAVADDGMTFMRYEGKWIVGAQSVGYHCIEVQPDHIKVLGPDGKVDIKKA